MTYSNISKNTNTHQNWQLAPFLNDLKFFFLDNRYSEWIDECEKVNNQEEEVDWRE